MAKAKKEKIGKEYLRPDGKFKSFDEYPDQGYWIDPRDVNFSARLEARARALRKQKGKARKGGVRNNADRVKTPFTAKQQKVLRSQMKKKSIGDASGITDYLRTGDLKRMRDAKIRRTPSVNKQYIRHKKNLLVG